MLSLNIVALNLLHESITVKIKELYLRPSPLQSDAVCGHPGSAHGGGDGGVGGRQPRPALHRGVLQLRGRPARPRQGEEVSRGLQVQERRVVRM